MTPFRARYLIALYTVGILCLAAESSPAQETSGSTRAAVAGGALGFYSGAVMGVGGSLIPCSQTYAGVRCVRLVGYAGAAIGLMSGVALGDGDADRVGRAYKGAGFGLLAGSVVGFALKEIVPHYGWRDVATAGGIGAAIGASARGAVLGFAAGAAVGTVLWATSPSFEVHDAVAVGLAGMAIGGLTSWVVRALDAQSDGPAAPEVIIPFSLKL